MPLFNVSATLQTTLVVVADDADHAHQVARENAGRAFDDANERPRLEVTGQVLSTADLKDGWDSACLPYGGDRNTRLSALLPAARAD